MSKYTRFSEALWDLKMVASFQTKYTAALDGREWRRKMRNTPVALWHQNF